MATPNGNKTTKKKVHLAFFGGAGDGPGLFHFRIVEQFADDALADPSRIGLSGAEVDPESKYLEWGDVVFGRRKARRVMEHIQTHCLAYPVVIVGHSWGAEAAMRTIRKMEGTRIAHLVTIDGVSWQSKLFGDECPPNVAEWTNVYVSGFSDFSDVVALMGGQWKHRKAATRNINAAKCKGPGKHVSHATFAAMWALALPYVKKSIGLG
ncbi:MAG: hypothetical protein ACYTG0_33940 [Planctomycetota bacterium]